MHVAQYYAAITSSDDWDTLTEIVYGFIFDDELTEEQVSELGKAIEKQRRIIDPIRMKEIDDSIIEYFKYFKNGIDNVL